MVISKDKTLYKNYLVKNKKGGSFDVKNQLGKESGGLSM